MVDPLEGIMLEIVKDRFPDAAIQSLSIKADNDSDGDPILRITVIFDAKVDKLEARRLAGLVRHVRPKLAELKEDRFPIFSFVNRQENERLRNAAA